MNGSDYKIGKLFMFEKVDDEQRPVFRITPRELDLGSVKPGETVFGEFHLKNVVPGMLDWSVSCPHDWESAGDHVITGVTSEAGDNLHVELSITENIGGLFTERAQTSNYRAVMKMESAGQEIICQKDVKSGLFRNSIRMTSTGGKRTVFINFRIHTLQDDPLISLNPQRLDFGMHLPGKIISKKIQLTNKGREILRWSVVLPKAISVSFLKELHNGRFFSFHNEGLLKEGQYFIPEHLKDSMELLGEWTESNGYPLSKGMASAIKFRFHGTGCSVFMKSHTENSGCSIYLDDILLKLPDMSSDSGEKKELVIAEGLRNGPHSITIVSREGGLEFEGVKIFGKEIIQGPRGWITVHPNSGKTLSETDYVDVQLNTSNIAPGSYGDQIVFKSNSGEEKASIFIDVLPGAMHKNMDVYLYSKDLDYVLTLNEHVEEAALKKNGYVKEGIAFRLFHPDTPGTASFYRWYNPVLKDHYYHYDRSGGGKSLDGYFFECSIGNIATSRMRGTRELYRWVNPSTGRHYYSTDSRAATGVRKGYRFDGIAGYVK
ncbi:MAG: hypothetical protein PHN98_04485 [Smithellaceae bacterium]|nr:hypothetical protein [Smithellaceae bacterium]